MQKRIAVALTLVVVSVIGVILWIRSTGRSGSGAPSSVIGAQANTEPTTTPSALATQHTADDRRTEIAPEPLTASAASGVQTNTLSVRSSIGLALPFIEWDARDPDWRRIDLDHGHCEIGPMKLPCLVRAPGHVAVTASKAGEEIVVEPDALLLLESSGLRSCTSSIQIWDPGQHGSQEEASMRPELRRAIAWGWVSEDRWALAVSSTLAADALTDHPVASVLRWRDGRRADIYFIAQAGARASWAVPCEDIIAHAPLDVQIVRPAQDRAGGIALQIWRVVEGGTSGRREKHPWGEVVFSAAEDYAQDAIIPAGVGAWQFGTAPTGVRLSLAGRDDGAGAYGRLVFVHDGSPRTLVLRPAFELSGRLVSDATSAPVATADLWVDFKDGKEIVWSWQSSARALALAADGGFVLRAPGNLLTLESEPLDPPAQLVLHVQAAGFETLKRSFDTGGAGRFDCGEVRLAPVHGQLVLAAGHGLSPKAVRWESLRTSSEPAIEWNVRDAAPLPDGGLEVFLLRSAEDPKLFHTFSEESRAWPTVPADRIVIHVLLGDGDESWAFERASDGRYAAVPRIKRHLEVECRALPSEGKSWWIGWQWREVWGVCAQVPSWRLGQKVRVQFSTPAEGAMVYWSADGAPPLPGKSLGGSVPIDALSGTLIVQ